MHNEARIVDSALVESDEDGVVAGSETDSPPGAVCPEVVSIVEMKVEAKVVIATDTRQVLSGE